MTGPADAVPLALRFEDATGGEAVGYERGILQVRAGRAYPPGKPLSLTVKCQDGLLPLAGRCLGSKKVDDGQFDIRVRLTNLTRSARLKLEAHYLA